MWYAVEATLVTATKIVFWILGFIAGAIIGLVRNKGSQPGDFDPFKKADDDLKKNRHSK